MIINCLSCNKEVKISPSRLGETKFCSRACYKPFRDSSLKESGEKTRYKKGSIPFSKLHPEVMKRGEDHYAWKGTTVGYRGLHYWLRRQMGEPTKCAFCGYMRQRAKDVQWANISGKYLREERDYVSLCASCHKTFDLTRVSTSQRSNNLY